MGIYQVFLNVENNNVLFLKNLDSLSLQTLRLLDKQVAFRGLILRTMALWKNKAYVNGDWVEAQSGNSFEVRNPANGKVLGKLPDMNEKDTEKALQVANTAFAEWSKTTGKASFPLFYLYVCIPTNSKVLQLEFYTRRCETLKLESPECPKIECLTRLELTVTYKVQSYHLKISERFSYFNFFFFNVQILRSVASY